MAGYDLERDARFDRCLKPFRPGSYPSGLAENGQPACSLMRGAGASILTRWGHLCALWRSLGFSHQPRSYRSQRALKPPSGGLALSRSPLSVNSRGPNMAPANNLVDGGSSVANEMDRGTFDPCPMPTAPTPSTIIDPALAIRIARVERMRPRELREVYRHTFGRDTTSGNRAWLVRAVTTRLREIDMSHQMPEALAVAGELAKDLGCQASFASYLETLPPCAPIPRPAEDAFERPLATEGRDPRIPTGLPPDS